MFLWLREDVCQTLELFSLSCASLSAPLLSITHHLCVQKSHVLIHILSQIFSCYSYASRQTLPFFNLLICVRLLFTCQLRNWVGFIINTIECYKTIYNNDMFVASIRGWVKTKTPVLEKPFLKLTGMQTTFSTVPTATFSILA